jgi:predicted CoA-substrate-specific enzyme activase
MHQDTTNRLSRSIGICLGASTLSAVELETTEDGAYRITGVRTKAHEGDPKTALTEYLSSADTAGACIGVTGRKFRRLVNLPVITEPEATEYAYRYVNRGNVPYDAVVSAGGESFLVYEMDRRGKISRVSSGNKCASGTGEFFLQQIRRMDVSIEDAIELSRTSEHPHELSGRCSVFCKSDCTHALNKGESIADVTAGLARMIAKKIEELLVKIDAKRVMIVGGTARNDVVIEFIRKNFELVEVPEEAPYFEALGAALWALETNRTADMSERELFREHDSSFEFQRPLEEFVRMVEFKEMPGGTPEEHDRCVLGLDVGSTTTKASVVRIADRRMLASVYLRTNGNPVKASRACYAGLLEQLGGVPVKIVGLGVTGSGRYIAGLHADTDTIINEIIAHAKAAAQFDPEVDTIFEIGGQDAKYTYLTNGVASDYAMNEACSAGTGSFLEESAWESMGVRMEEIAPIALSAKNPPNFADQCAAFISSDIKTAAQEGIRREDIIAGLVYSICINYVNRVKGHRQVGRKIFMQGGVCYNRAVPVAMAALTGKEIIVPPEPGLMGAYGVALEVMNMLELGLAEEKAFDLAELAAREVEYGKSFICGGGKEKCDRKCEINMIHVAGKKVPFGGACNLYYNISHNLSYDVGALNHEPARREIVFSRFVKPRTDLPETAPTVGINRSFQTNTLYPMYHTFFSELGCRVLLPDTVNEEAVKKGMTSFCLSGQIALGMFDTLLSMNPDYIFMPQIMEMHVSEQKEYRKEYQTVCMFVQGEPFYQIATFLRGEDGEDDSDTDAKADTGEPAGAARKRPVMLAPALNFMRGFDTQEEVFVDVARRMGFDEDSAKRAHGKAVEAQAAAFAAMKEEGRKILAELERNPEEFAVVLFGRPYNAFALEANKGVPAKFASRGVRIIPYDFLPYEQEENYKDTYWEMGQRIIKAARIVKRHPQLYGCYLTNFLCALDSMMAPHFRDLMGSKPSLTIEVDEHTADAGVNTRIEAFLDVVRNYRKIRDRIAEPANGFIPAKIRVNETGKVEYIDSDGNRFSIKDKAEVRVLVPSMGDLFAEGAAACLRHMGWNASALPVCDREALDLGRAVTTGKECLPIINIIGELLKYLKYRENPDEKIAIFLVSAGGCCRVGQYRILMQTVIEKLGLRNVAVITLENDSGYAGLGIGFRLDMVKIMFAADVLDDIRSAVRAMAVDKDAATEILYREFGKLCDSISRKSRVPFYRQLKASAAELAKIALERPISEAKYIGVVGEIFVRRDHFSLMGIPERLAANGFVMLDAHVMEWMRYTDFMRDIGMYEAKTNLIGRIESALSNIIQNRTERNVKKTLAASGLYEYELLDIYRYMNHSKHLFPWTLTGEPGLSTGASLYHLVDKYCGVINIGPFGCMNSRMTEAVTTAEMTIEGKERAAAEAGIPVDLSAVRERVDVLPFLSIESDGNPFSQIIEARLETFMIQANRLYEAMMEARKTGRRAGRDELERAVRGNGNGSNGGGTHGGNGSNGTGSAGGRDAAGDRETVGVN